MGERNNERAPRRGKKATSGRLVEESFSVDLGDKVEERKTPIPGTNMDMVEEVYEVKGPLRRTRRSRRIN